ncbi:hypothetical protein FOXG_02548 [Fusarium oxysporum f. sp. lycopersici 4287]|uniref:Apple domain-containing protein n=2 Tax=Fusarium oxysporum TaxID=5507 RepID=A0A0J9UH04_FUSO4|nr:hypothetical protein FOXG_02548 [Fusarium oxysporum f. sp. lycopersici 4287]KNA98122.1 hypothetical protein FOXG_02548 [Fusarium oxysporum f. sp. lycopersici 4287]
MPHRCKSSAWDQNQSACVFSSNSIFTSAFTSDSGDDSDMNWSDQSCFKCFCHDQDRDAYSASLRTALPTATCTPSITSEDAVCSIKQVDAGDLVCQHQGYFPWQWDEAPSKFPNQDSEERCAALCNSNPDCQASGWSEEYGKCAIGGFQLKDITWQQFGDTKYGPRVTSGVSTHEFWPAKRISAFIINFCSSETTVVVEFGVTLLRPQ